jgi:hypothetical protein
VSVRCDYWDRDSCGRTYTPFVVIRPDVHSLSPDVLRLEERQRRLGRGHLHRYVLVLEGCSRGAPRDGVRRKEIGKQELWWFTTNLEELVNYEGRLDGRDAARRDEKNVRVSFALVDCCSKLPCHLLVPPSKSTKPSPVHRLVSTGESSDRHELPDRDRR